MIIEKERMKADDPTKRQKQIIDCVGANCKDGRMV